MPQQRIYFNPQTGDRVDPKDAGEAANGVFYNTQTGDRVSASDGAAPEGKSFKGFLSNAAEDAGRFASGIAQTVAHPIKTLEGLNDLAEGTFQLTGLNPLGSADKTALPKAVGKHYLKLAKHPIDTAYEQPISTMADIATILQGAGLTKAAGFADPIRLAAKPIAKLAGPAGRTAERLYASALKVPKTLRNKEDMAQVIREGLDTKTVANAAGRDRTWEAANSLDDQVGTVSEQAAAAGVEIPGAVAEKAVGGRYAPLEAKVAGIGQAPSDRTATRQIRAAMEKDLTKETPIPVEQWSSEQLQAVMNGAPEPTAKNWEDLSPSKVNVDRKNLNEAIRDKANFRKWQGAPMQARKANAGALSDMLKEGVPATKPLLEQESRKIGLAKALDEAVGRWGNRDITDLKTYGGIATGKMLPIIFGVFDRMSPKSRVAIGLDLLSKGTHVPPGWASPTYESMLRQAMLEQLGGQLPE